MRAIRRYGAHVAAIAALVALASAVGGYILVNQRLPLPWDDVYTVRAEFQTAQAVTPGQGQTVTVAGVEVGEVGSVELVDGRAVVTLEIERDQLPAVYADARMLLRPRTPLNDMTIKLDPGSPRAGRLGSDQVLSIARTSPAVNVDEVLAALDTDTRAYLRTLLNAGGRALRGRGHDLRAVLRASGPTLERTRAVTAALSGRRRELRRLVRAMRLLSGELGGRGDELRGLVAGSEAAFGALAREEAALRESLARLPGTLSAADGALRALSPLSQELGPALGRLRPTVRRLAPALGDVRPLLREGAPQLRPVRRLVAAAQPVVRDLRPAAAALRRQTPALVSAFDDLNYVVNELAYNPDPPHHGYLFWLAWFAHNANSMLSVADANGSFWRGQLVSSCSTLAGNEASLPLVAPLYLSQACPESP